MKQYENEFTDEFKEIIIKRENGDTVIVKQPIKK